MNPGTAYTESTLPSVSAPEHAPSLGTDLSELTKARLTVMVLITTVAGYGIAHTGTMDWWKLGHTLMGTALVAVCSSIFNQALERKTDAWMRRTQQRPFVTHRLPLLETVQIGAVLGALGLFELVWFVNALSALLATLTLVIYAFIYTPLKRISSLNTLVGAIPGALPPLLGAVAARGAFSVEGWTLFGLLACWQLPHFYAIAWLYREDYRIAGLKMISAYDKTGAKTGAHALISALILLPVSLLPVWLGQAGIFYTLCALILGTGFIWPALLFQAKPSDTRARCLFLTSIAYLPLILAALVADLPIKAWIGF